MRTTFNNQKQNAVQYLLGKKGKNGRTIVVFETRHELGNLLVETLAKEGIDVNNLVTRKGKPKKELVEMVTGIIKKEGNTDPIPENLVTKKDSLNNKTKHGLNTGCGSRERQYEGRRNGRY